MELLHSIFEEHYVVDDREPCLNFHIPTMDGKFSLYAPEIGLWIQLLASGFLQILIQVTAAVFIYEAIVKRRGYIGSFIIGWGFIIPAAFYLPFYLVDTFDIRNKVVALGTSTASSVIMFRCIEAMYGTSPEFAELSISNYCTYYSCMPPLVWSKKTKTVDRIPGMEIVRLSLQRLFGIFALSFIFSVMIHYDYKPFEDKVDLTSFDMTTDLLSFGHICNSYLYTILFYFALNTLFELNAFQYNCMGLKTGRLFNDPFILSKTPTEFWTKRWNKMTHRMLKQGIFEPAKLCIRNKTVVVFLTFVVSGLYHEYCWIPMFVYPKYIQEEGSAYEYKFGRVTAFFAYTGIIMMLERPLKKLPLVQWMASNLPTFVIAQLLVLIHTPVVKWYGGDWIEGGLFNDFSIMTFLIRKN